jgi:hypothetical protein
LIIDVVARVGLVMSGAYLITTRIREALIVRMVPSRERVGRGHGPLRPWVRIHADNVAMNGDLQESQRR